MEFKDNLSEEEKNAILYESCVNEFFVKNYNSLINLFLQQEHDKFMQYVEDMYENAQGTSIELEIKK